MALPKQVGDDVVFQSIDVQTTAKPIVPGGEPNENVVGFIVIAHPDNVARVFVGAANTQPLPIGPSSLALSPSIEFKLTRRNKVFVRGTPPDKVIVVTVLTTGCLGKPAR